MVRRGAVSARRRIRAGAAVLGLAGLVITATGLAVTAAGPAAASSWAAAPRTAPLAVRDGFTPRRHGRLRITGRLRDGGMVAAAGLGWRPGRLPRGDHLLSFEVGYAWRACDQAGRRCVTGAGTTATPFAARRYQVGHARGGLAFQQAHRIRAVRSRVVAGVALPGYRRPGRLAPLGPFGRGQPSGRRVQGEPPAGSQRY